MATSQFFREGTLRGPWGAASREQFGPKTPWLPPFGNTNSENYVKCLSVLWRDVWRHVGLSDANNSEQKGAESKRYSSFTVFFATVFVLLIFWFFLPGFLKITFGILDEFWFCFFFFVHFTHLHHRAKPHVDIRKFPGVIPAQRSILYPFFGVVFFAFR